MGDPSIQKHTAHNRKDNKLRRLERVLDNAALSNPTYKFGRVGLGQQIASTMLFRICTFELTAVKRKFESCSILALVRPTCDRLSAGDDRALERYGAGLKPIRFRANLFMTRTLAQFLLRAAENFLGLHTVEDPSLH